MYKVLYIQPLKHLFFCLAPTIPTTTAFDQFLIFSCLNQNINFLFGLSAVSPIWFSLPDARITLLKNLI